MRTYIKEIKWYAPNTLYKRIELRFKPTYIWLDKLKDVYLGVHVCVYGVYAFLLGEITFNPQYSLCFNSSLVYSSECV